MGVRLVVTHPRHNQRGPSAAHLVGWWTVPPGHPDKVVDAVSAHREAGFTDVALVQVGDEGQDRFLAEAAGPLLDKLRAAAP